MPGVRVKSFESVCPFATPERTGLMSRHLRAGLLSALFVVPWLVLPSMPILAFTLWICGVW